VQISGVFDVHVGTEARVKALLLSGNERQEAGMSLGNHAFIWLFGLPLPVLLLLAIWMHP
jgi:hypothetical protein